MELLDYDNNAFVGPDVGGQGDTRNGMDNLHARIYSRAIRSSTAGRRLPTTFVLDRLRAIRLKIFAVDRRSDRSTPTGGPRYGVHFAIDRGAPSTSVPLRPGDDRGSFADCTGA